MVAGRGTVAAALLKAAAANGGIWPGGSCGAACGNGTSCPGIWAGWRAAKEPGWRTPAAGYVLCG